MLKQKIRNYISLFLILFLMLQFIPGTFENVECLDNHTPKTSIIFSTSAVHMDIAFLITDGRKTTFHLMPAESYARLIEHIYFADVSENKFIYIKAPTDYCKEIEKTILHYFHGSKYKDGSLFI